MFRKFFLMFKLPERLSPLGYIRALMIRAIFALVFPAIIVTLMLWEASNSKLFPPAVALLILAPGLAAFAFAVISFNPTRARLRDIGLPQWLAIMPVLLFYFLPLLAFALPGGDDLKNLLALSIGGPFVPIVVFALLPSNLFRQ